MLKMHRIVKAADILGLEPFNRLNPSEQAADEKLRLAQSSTAGRFQSQTLPPSSLTCAWRATTFKPLKKGTEESQGLTTWGACFGMRHSPQPVSPSLFL